VNLAALRGVVFHRLIRSVFSSSVSLRARPEHTGEQPEAEQEDRHAENDLQGFHEEHDEADSQEPGCMKNCTLQSVLCVAFEYGDNEAKEPPE
jgi:hypothetical protein